MKMWRTLPGALRQAAVYALALGLAKGVSLLMVPVFTHYLEPADYGRLDVLQTLADLLSVVIGLGLADTMFRFSGGATNEAERKRVAADVFALSLFSGLIFLVIAQIGAPWIAAVLPGGVSVGQTRLILASLAFSAVILVPLSWFRMRGKAGWYLLGSGGRAVFQAVMAAALLAMGFGVSGVLAGGFVACVTLAAVAGWLFMRDAGRPMRPARPGRYFRYGGPLVLAGASAFVLGSFDRWILAAEIGPGNMATYALAAKFALITAFLVQPFELWWTGRRFSLLGETGGAEKCARASGVGITVVLLAMLAVATAAPTAIRLLTPESYHGATQFAPWLAALAGLRAVTGMVNLGLYTGENTLRPLAIEMTSAGVALGLYLFLIPLFGVWGAISSTAVVLVLRLAATVWLAQRQTRIPYSMLRLAGLGLTALSGLAVIISTQDSMLQIAVGMAALMTTALVALILGLAPVPPAIRRRISVAPGAI